MVIKGKMKENWTNDEMVRKVMKIGVEESRRKIRSEENWVEYILGERCGGNVEFMGKC